MNLYSIIKFPVFSNKASNLLKQRKITCKTQTNIDKYQVKKAFLHVFNVNVNLKNIKAINIRGKIKRFKHLSGKQKNEKKFIIDIDKKFDINKILTGKIDE